MQAVDLRARVGFYKRENQSDGYGNYQAGYAVDPEFIVAANIKPVLYGSEVIQAARLTGKGLLNITVRQSSDTSLVTTDWQAKNERTGEIFNIRAIDDPDQHTAQHGRFWEMRCEKGVAV